MASRTDRATGLLWMTALAFAWRGAAGIEVEPPVLVSRTPANLPTGGLCYAPVLSRSGRFTSYSCYAFDIIYGEPGVGDALLHDAQTGAIIGLSYTDQGAWGDCGGAELGTCTSAALDIAEDGSEVVLKSGAPLTQDAPPPGPDFGMQEVYLRHTVDQTTEWLTRRLRLPDTAFPQGCDGSMERSEILIATPVNFTDEPDGNGGLRDLFVVNWETRDVELVSASPVGEQGDGHSGCGRFSPDGRYVVFMSSANNLTGDNPQHFHNLFLRDRALGTTRRLTFPWAGGEFSAQPNILPTTRITADNRYVLFPSSGSEFTPDSDPDVPLAVYEIDLLGGQTRLVSRGVDDEPLNASAFGASFSDDGRYMAFMTSASNVSEEPGPLPAIFVRDRLTGETVNVSAALGTPPYSLTDGGTISADGSTVAFEWPEWNTAHPTLLNNQQIYTVRLRGVPPSAPSVPVPAASRTGLLVLVALLAALAWLAAQTRSENR